MDYANKPLADALAAQYVAGTLRGGARRRFEALLPGHPALRAAVADWQARLMPLTAVIDEQAPPAHTWDRIAQRLWPEPAAAAPPAAPAAAVVARPGLLARPVGPGHGGGAGAGGAAGPARCRRAAGDGGAADHRQGPAAVAGSVVASFSADGRAAVARPVQPVACSPTARWSCGGPPSRRQAASRWA